MIYICRKWPEILQNMPYRDPCMKSNNMRSKPDVDSTGPSWSQCRCGMTLMGAVVSRAKVTRQTAGTEASNKARICGLTICVSPVPWSLKFRHFSTNDRAEFPSNIRISGTSSYFLFTGVHYTKVSSRPRKKDSGGAWPWLSVPRSKLEVPSF